MFKIKKSVFKTALKQISDIRKNKDKILKFSDNISLIFIFSIIWTLDYPDFLLKSRRVWIIEVRL